MYYFIIQFAVLWEINIVGKKLQNNLKFDSSFALKIHKPSFLKRA